MATAWCLHDFNFTGAVFDGGAFATSHFRGAVSFYGATFSSGTVTVRGATFSGTRIDWGPLPVLAGA
ncbi:hypothetical protein CG723_45275 [Streptomyces sp. CB01635]|nr:hypothetical protein CG723_45275 [Streptomyces sp. CB01635]